MTNSSRKAQNALRELRYSICVLRANSRRVDEDKKGTLGPTRSGAFRPALTVRLRWPKARILIHWINFRVLRAPKTCAKGPGKLAPRWEPEGSALVVFP